MRVDVSYVHRMEGSDVGLVQLPNNSLSLRSPIHHLCLAHLPDSETLLVSGTKAGTVRRYDTRQRKPVSDWKVAKEGGVGCVASGAEQ